MKKVHTCVLTSLWVLLAISSAEVRAQDPDNKKPFVRFSLKDRPSLQLGKLLRIDLRAKAQIDDRELSPPFETTDAGFDINRVRIGIEGEFLHHFNYEAERELRRELGGRESKYPWRDVWINFKRFDNFQVKVGKFKVPFSMEQLTSVSKLEFANRSRTAEDLAPARDLGAVVHGRFFNRRLGYEAGVFRHDGENGASDADVRGGRAWAARVTGQPLQLLSLPGDWDEVELGVAAVSASVVEGLNSLRARTVAGAVYFPHVYVQGRRLRVAGEASWRPGPFSLQGELIRIKEDREGQSVRADDLPAKISQGWYLTGTWAITGESKKNGIEPKHPFLSEGIGAVEVAIRYEEIVFKSGEASGPKFRSPRAANLWPSRDQVWTLGVNWYLNRIMKIQVNGTRETLQDVERSPVEGRDRLWMGVASFQFSM